MNHSVSFQKSVSVCKTLCLSIKSGCFLFELKTKPQNLVANCEKCHCRLKLEELWLLQMQYIGVDESLAEVDVFCVLVCLISFLDSFLV